MKYALMNKETGKLIALDRASGGYPYDVDSIWRAQLWDDFADAMRYTAVSSWKDYDNPVYDLVSVPEPDYSVIPGAMLTGADLEALRYEKKNPR